MLFTPCAFADAVAADDAASTDAAADEAASDDAGKTVPLIEAADMEVVFSLEPFEPDVWTESDGALSFEVADEDVATVDADGLVSCVCAGATTVTVTVAQTDDFLSASVTFSLVVVPTVDAPVLSGIERTGEDITLTWDAVEGAGFYRVFRKVGTGSWERIAQVKVSSGADAAFSFTDSGLAQGVTTFYRVRAFGLAAGDRSAFSGKLGYRSLASPSATAENQKGGILVTWTKVAGASGYRLYRDGVLVATLTSAKTLSYADSAIKNGASYTYAVEPYHASTSSTGDAAQAAVNRVKRSAVAASRSKSGKKLTVAWAANAKATGYQVQYSSSPLFTSKKTLKITDPATTSTVISGLDASKTYYVRVRGYLKAGGVTSRGAWSYSSAVKTTKVAAVSCVKASGAKVELRTLSKQKMKGYDTVQGSCTDGTFGYYVMYNRTVEKCKIAKVRLSDMKLVKVSGVLNIKHGNGITYNADTGKLMVTHTRVETKKVSAIDAATLKVESTTTIGLSSAVAGIKASQASSQKGYSAIAYNSSRKQYVLLERTRGNLVVTDENLVPVRYIVPTKKAGQLLQSLDVTDDYILVASSFKGSKKYNVVMVYDWEGAFVTKIRLGAGYELESIYHVGNKFYASTYRSYYKTTYTYTTVTRKVNGTTKKVKVRVAKKTLVRDNYLYRFTF